MLPALILAQLIALYVLARGLQLQLSSLLVRLTKNSQASVWLMALLFLPGTFVHELSHLLTAWLLLVPARGFSLWPKVQGNRVVMGHVLIPKVDPLRMAIIGLAPLCLGLLGSLGLVWLAYQNQWWNLSWYWQVLAIYGLFQISHAMFPSWADIKTSRFLLMVLAGVVVLAIFTRTLTLDHLHHLSTTYQPVLTTIHQLLYIPLLLNGLLLIPFVLLAQLKPANVS